MNGKDYRQQITTIYIYPNGMILVFDQKGRQMPRFQGHNDLKRLKRIQNRIYRQRFKEVTWTEFMSKPSLNENN